MRVACYLRVSSEEQAVHGYSLAHQETACRAYAARMGATEVVCFADQGVSGALLERPGLTALREAVRAGQVQAVVVYDPDRLARSLAHQLLLTEEWERAGLRLEFVNFQWQDSPEGRLFYSLRGAVAEYEKEKIRDRTTAGRIQKARLGKMPVANAPYGYRYRRADAALEVVPEEAAVVASVFRAWNDGASLSAIARRLTAAGIPTRTGAAAWHRQTIRQMLANPAYQGIFYSRRFDHGGVALNRHRPPGEKRQPRLRPPAEWIAVPVPAVVDPAEWERAQQRLRTARAAGRPPDSPYLLSGLARCGRCGGRLVGTRRSYWGRRRRTYLCRPRPSGGCGRLVLAQPVEAAVWERVVGWLDRPAQAAAAFATPAAAAVPVQRERLLAARRRLLLALERGWAEPDEVAAGLSRLRRQLQALEATAAAPPAVDPLEQARHALADLTGRSTSEQRRQLLRLLLRQVVVGTDTLVLHANLARPDPPPAARV